ncbi:MAG TPA: hypothetical protein PL009_13005 [Flavipsychrobacter sp.]|nr:hypothetical protein [Flavipsychrobacter sp.]
MILYLLAVSGVMINLHYCGTTLENWSVYAESNGCEDGDCGDEKQVPDECCENKIITSKISHDQHLAAFLKITVAQFEYALLPQNFSFSITELKPSDPQSISHQPNAPPGLWENIPLYKLHSRFTYYG